MRVKVIYAIIACIIALVIAVMFPTLQPHVTQPSTSNHLTQNKNKVCMFMDCITCVEKITVHAIAFAVDKEGGAYAYARATGCICIPSDANIHDTDHGHDWWVPKEAIWSHVHTGHVYLEYGDKGDEYIASTVVHYMLPGDSELRIVPAHAKIHAPPKCTT